MADFGDWALFRDTEIDGIAIFDGFDEVVFRQDGVEPNYWSVFLTYHRTAEHWGRECFGDYLTLDAARQAARRCDVEIVRAIGRRVDGVH